jgi:cytochrome c biogenesis protein CcmG/thiol:disulfide interchange protein DsbE
MESILPFDPPRPGSGLLAGAKRYAARRARVIRAFALGALIACLCVTSTATAAELDMQRFRGKVVIVDFWASWCKPCRQSIPWLNEMRTRYGASGLIIVGVNVDAERGDAERFLREVPIEFEVVFDPQGELAQKFGIKGMPSSYFFDRSGKMVGTHLGFRAAKKAENEAALEKLLNSSPD